MSMRLYEQAVLMVDSYDMSYESRVVLMQAVLIAYSNKIKILHSKLLDLPYDSQYQHN